jgi:preprotein translocase subunit SecG
MKRLLTYVLLYAYLIITTVLLAIYSSDESKYHINIRASDAADSIGNLVIAAIILSIPPLLGILFVLCTKRYTESNLNGQQHYTVHDDCCTKIVVNVAFLSFICSEIISYIAFITHCINYKCYNMKTATPLYVLMMIVFHVFTVITMILCFQCAQQSIRQDREEQQTNYNTMVSTNNNV